MQAGIAIKKASGKPLVVHVHSLETDRIGMAGRNARNKIYHIEYNSMMQADLVLPVSHYTKSQILEHYPGIAPDKIVPVYNAIDHDDMAAELPDIVQTPIATNRKIVLFMGRITYQKGPEFLLQTAEHLLSIDKEIRFVVVGSGDMQSWMTARVAEKELGEYFVFTGYLPPHRLGELLRVANVYFMPSVSEPFGLAALEAAQFGVPSVISRQSGVSEVLQGVLKADCWDTIQFANYIYALLHYKSLREVLVAENKAAINSMSWDKTAQQVVELYQQLLESTTASLLQPL
jgi:glycosyltransferase involved in cell wall biosynthesis